MQTKYLDEKLEEVRQDGYLNYRTSELPTWCPGCGYFGITHAMVQTVNELGLKNEEIVAVSGIGCAGRYPIFMDVYGFHTLHGRSVPIASGENACTHVEFARTIPKITYTQPSVIKVGGISEFMGVCYLAATAGKTLMPHAPYFGPGYWATLQLMSAQPHCELFEFLYIEPEAWLDPSIPLPRDGYVRVPEKPGLGFEPDEGAIAKYRV